MLSHAERDRAVRHLLGTRPHREGCPAEDPEADTGRVEAWEDKAVAPSADLERRGIEPGAVVTVLRCVECSGIRHLAGPLDEHLDRFEAAS